MKTKNWPIITPLLKEGKDPKDVRKYLKDDKQEIGVEPGEREEDTHQTIWFQKKNK